MADQTTNRKINIFIETGAAQAAFEKLDAKAKAFTAELSTTTDKGRIKEIQKELAALSGPLDVARKKVSGELAPSMKDLQKVVNDLGNRMKRMSTTDADFSSVLKQYSQAKTQLQGIKNEVKAVEEAQRNAGNTNPFGKVLDFAKGAFAGGALLSIVQGAIGGIADFITGSLKEAFDAEESSARLKATLDNLGRSDAFDRITKKADEMAQKFKYLDNDDIVKVFNKLIDYGKLTEKQMNDLMPVIIDFAAKQRISIEESTDVIVKALNGNGKAMKQYGVEMRDGGDTATQLGIIMTTLKAKVDGAGEAFQQTAAGGVAKAKQEFANLKEEVGNKLIPVLNGLLNGTDKVVTGLGYLSQKTKDLAIDIGAFFGNVSAQTAKAEREANRMAQINKQAGENIVAGFAGKSMEEIEAEITRQNGVLRFKENLLAAKQRLLKEGAISQDDFDKEVADTKQGIEVVKNAIGKLNELKAAGSGGTLGISNQGDNEAAKDAEQKAKETQRKRDAEAKKILEDQKRLQDELHKLHEQLTVANDSEMDKELAAVAIKYEEMAKLAHGNGELLKQTETQLQEEMLAIMVKYGRKQTDEFQKLSEQQRAEKEKEHQKLVQQAQQQAIRMGQELAKVQSQLGRDQVAGLELDLLKAHGVKKLEVEKKLLEQRMQQELQNENLTQKERELIAEQYRLKQQDLERNHWQNIANITLEFMGQALQVLDQFGQAQTARENAALERDRADNDKKKGNYKRQLDSKQITKQEYDRKVADLDKQQEKKEHEAQVKQFKRNQRMQIANALISGAQAAQKTIAEWGMPFAIPWLALTVASTVAQIATIAAQKPPEMARGGLLHGPSHKSKSRGMPVINPATGHTQALLEGGEAITNKRTMADRGTYSVSGTPSQIISTLNAMHGGVAWDSPVRLVPAWQSATPRQMNFGNIGRSFRTVRLFENGGVFDDGTGGSGSTNAVSNPAFDPAILLALATVVNNLDDTIKGGINASLSLSHFENQQARRQAIVDAGTMKA